MFGSGGTPSSNRAAFRQQSHAEELSLTKMSVKKRLTGLIRLATTHLRYHTTYLGVNGLYLLIASARALHWRMRSHRAAELCPHSAALLGDGSVASSLAVRSPK